MNVHELIEKLRRFNPEDDVYVRNYEDDMMDEYSPDNVSVNITVSGAEHGIILSL